MFDNLTIDELSMDPDDLSYYNPQDVESVFGQN